MQRDRELFRVAHLVVGGLAVRLDLTFENLEDLQVALASLLREEDGEVTVSLAVEGERIEAAVGPFEGAALDAELAREIEDGVALRRVLETVCDRVEIAERDVGRWVELTKSVRQKTDAG